MRARVMRLGCLGLLVCMVATCATRADDMPVELDRPRASYTYDSSGRLGSVTDDRGRTAVYQYDEVGNIVGITRPSSGGDDGSSSSAPRPARGPTITGLSAEVVAPGSTLTIEGRRFSSDPLLNAVQLGGTTYARVESASESALEVTVPPLAPAGPLTVSTPDGTATSEPNVFVVPPGIEPDTVSSAQRVRLGHERELELGGEDAVSLLGFHGTTGQRVEVRVPPGESSVSDLCAVGLRLFGPDTSALWEPELSDITCMENRMELPLLPAAGRYLLVLAPESTAPEQLRVTVDEVDPDTPLPAPDNDEDEGDDDEDLAEADIPPGIDPELLVPPELEDPGASAAPDGVYDGAAAYPIDLTRGQGVLQATDMALPGALPLMVARGYDGGGEGLAAISPGAFGRGADLDLELKMTPTPGFQFAEVETANGLPVAGFVRTSDGVEHHDAVFEHRETPSAFYGARATWNGTGWDLTLADGLTMVFPGKLIAPLAAIRDRNGNQITILRQLDDRGRARGLVGAAVSADGGWLEFTYDDRDRVVAIVDHLGRTVSYGYDSPESIGRLATVTYPDGSTVSYTYDEDNRLVSITGPGGIALVTNTYDDDGRVVRQVLGDGATFSFAYTLDAEERVTQAEVTDPAGLVRRLVVAEGQWTSDTWAVGTAQEATVQLERDPTSQFVTAVVGPDGRRDGFGYDETGNMVSSTAAEGSSSPFGTELAYGDTGGVPQVESTSDSGGRSSSFRYDDAGNLAAVVDPYGAETTYRYDRSGRLVRLTDPSGSTTHIEYEGAHRVTVIDPAGNERSEFYDSAGRLAVVQDAVGNRSRLTYDAADRELSVVDPAGASTQFAYNPAGNLASVVDAVGNTTTYGYDAVGRVTSRTDPAGATDRSTYDTAGNLVGHTDRRGVQSSFSYDGLGRPTAAAFGIDQGGAESTVSYAYDAAGRLTEVNDSAYGVVRLAYDDLDRLVSETTAAGEVRYSYDAAGRRTSATVPGGGPETTYSYDSAGLLASISQGSDAEVSFSRDPLGRARTVSLPNDVTGQYEYDERGLLATVEYDDLGRVGYRYDAAGRRVEDVGGLAGTELPAAEADAAHEAGNRLTGWADRSLTYDAAGNLVSDGENTYRWDARGQLAGIDGPVPATFTYDPLGRRATKTVDGTTTTYLYDGANVLQETTGADPPVTYLTGFGPDQIYARSSGEGTTAYLRDGLGSVLGLVGDSGEIDTSYTYGPFGATSVDGDETDPNPFGFTGREQDETGLYYYRARYYSSELGRFLSEDPLGFAAGDLNLYAYVGNNPTNLVDPSGQCIGAATDLLLEAFAIEEQLRLILRNFAELGDQFYIANDNLLRRLNDAQNAFYIACGAETFLLPGITHIAGRGLSAFGRTHGGLGRTATNVIDDLPEVADDAPLLAYRGGSRSADNLTPRPGRDTTGLSTFDNPSAAAPPGGKVQVIDTSKLTCTVACPDAPPPGHISIGPRDPADIPGWAATRGTGVVHPFTQDILDAIVDTIRLPRP